LKQGKKSSRFVDTRFLKSTANKAYKNSKIRCWIFIEYTGCTFQVKSTEDKRNARKSINGITVTPETS